MSTVNAKQASELKTVETVVNELLNGRFPIKSIVVVSDVAGGVILGEADDTDHELELAAGVTYLVIGLGKLETAYEAGINFVDLQ